MLLLLLIVFVCMYCVCVSCDFFCFFFFKQKTAYEMRISDWSSDVCSSDLLEAMLSKDPAPENLEEEGAEDNGEISEKTAGVSFKDEDEVEEEPSADGDDENGEGSSGKRESFEEDEEDNTLSLAAMEELLKPDALEKDRKSTRLNSSHSCATRMPAS